MTRVRGSRLGGGRLAALAPWMSAPVFLALIYVAKEAVAHSDRYQVSPDLVSLAGVPTDLQEKAWLIHGPAPILDGPRSIFDPELPLLAAQALAERPWIEEVISVRRGFPALLEVAVRVRRPLAVVVEGAEHLAVDAHGVVLESESPMGPPDYPLIRLPGAPLSRVPYVGHRFWQDGVQEALALLVDLQQKGNHPALDSFRIVEVRVGQEDSRRRPGASDLRLLFDSGVEVLWGRSPIASLASLEPPAATKLDNLLRLLRSFPGLVGVQLVDLRFRDPEVVLRRH